MLRAIELHADMRELLDYLTLSNGRLLVHQLVLDEAVSGWDSRATDVLAKLQQQLGNKLDSRRIARDWASTRDTALAEFTAHPTVEVVPFASEALRALARRYLDRQRPFRTDATKGDWFDAILWQDLLAGLPRGADLIFLSSDARAFANDDSNSIHDDLRIEAQERAIRVTLYPDVLQYLASVFKVITVEERRILLRKLDDVALRKLVLDSIMRDYNWFHESFEFDRKYTVTGRDPVPRELVLELREGSPEDVETSSRYFLEFWATLDLDLEIRRVVFDADGDRREGEVATVVYQSSIGVIAVVDKAGTIEDLWLMGGGGGVVEDE